MEELEASQIPKKEELKGLRWVAITGTLDHKKMRENYLDALKNPSGGRPVLQEARRRAPGPPTRRLVVGVDRRRPGREPEDPRQPPRRGRGADARDVRIAELVDPLPFLKAGYWEKVHVASLVPLERREIAPTADCEAGRIHAGHDADGGWRGMGMAWGWATWPGMGRHGRHGRHDAAWAWAG